MSQLSTSLGHYVSHMVERDGLYMHTENADVRIRVWSSNVIQVHISINDHADSFSYAIDSSPAKTKFNIVERKSHFQIITSAIILTIRKDPIRFLFHDKKGRLINSDDPAFGTAWIGDEMTTYKELQQGERFIGLGEKTRNLDRRGEAFTNWNTDAFAYNGWTDPLYTSTPFYIGIQNDLSYGIFLDNSHKSKFNFGASNNRFASFSVEGGDMSYYFIHHDQVLDIVKSYVKLTGLTPLPPKWSLGYQQCRYSYYPESEIEEIASVFRDKKIPCDVLYLDIHYMDKYKLFTWDKDRFPNPKALIAKLKKKGFRVVVIVDPGIKIEKNYKAYEDGLANDVFVKYPDGKEYSANVWPGECHFPDFTNEKVREWWGKQMKSLLDVGLEGFWNDMNEPASWGQDTPDNIEFHHEGNRSSHKKARNIYGMQMARSTYESAFNYLKNKRPFILSRSGFSGVQRYAAIWTGDNTAGDESMMVGARIVANLGLAGIPFAGYDVGGFVGDASVGLYKRWIALGAFAPFYRGHTMINSKRSEPWSYGEETEEIARNYISLRYRLMPYIYSCFKDASTNGTPIARSLALDYTHDSQIYNHQFQNQYLFGPAIMVCPVESDKEFRKVYLPKGDWYDMWNDNKFRGSREYVVEVPGHRLPVYIKASSIIPMESQVQHMMEKSGDMLFLHIYAGRSGSRFSYYEDDGETYNYKKGEFYSREIVFNPSNKTIELTKVIGKYKGHFEKLRIYFHGFSLKRISVNGKRVKIEKERYQFLQAISNFDPFYASEDSSMLIDELPYVDFKNMKRAISIKYS